MQINRKITNIEDYLNSLSPKQLEIVERLRVLIKQTVPEVLEKVMWSTPWYQLNKKPLVYIATTSTHTNFGFAQGSKLSYERMEGTGKNMRHIKIRNLDEIDEKEFTRLLKDSQKL